MSEGTPGFINLPFDSLVHIVGRASPSNLVVGVIHALCKGGRPSEEDRGIGAGNCRLVARRVHWLTEQRRFISACAEAEASVRSFHL
jgi:hypothetical protein